MKRFHLAYCAFALVVTACGTTSSTSSNQTSVVAKGSRVLGMDTNDASADFTFVQSFAAAQSIGVGAATLHIDWVTDEAAASGTTTSGTFTDAGGALTAANAYYPALTSPAKLSLTLGPIDTPGKEFPSDLSSMNIDNSIVITRFEHFLDWVLPQLSASTLTSIQIGNEIDAPSAASSATYWSQYKTFITAIVAHIHAAKPGLKVGFTVTLYGLTGSNGATIGNGILSLLSSVDEVGVTYYPLTGSFTVKDPSVVAGDFAAAVTAAGSTPVYFQEVGYPTSSTCGSSEDLQAEFIDQVFAAWDAHAAQVPFLSLLRLNDYSAANASSIAGNYGLAGNAAFVAYLQTLGLRTYGSPSAYKASWSHLQARTQERGW